jgi:hypothetical protein
MDAKLTQDEEVTNYHTLQHIRTVEKFVHIFIRELLERAEKHDLSKLQQPEVELFTKYTPKLASSTYGSEEYNSFRKEMAVALEHHYANNRHHPEHFKNGVNDMNLIDLVEMLCDWKASSMRHNDGNIRKSIEINAVRFGINPQLVKILENTAEFFDQ